MWQMRICHLIYDDPENPWLAGGGSARVREVYRRMAERHRITVISGPFPGAEPVMEMNGVRHVRVGSARTYAGSRIAYCRHAVAELRSRRWDLWVNDFSPYAPLRVPSTVRRRGILVLHHVLGRHALKHRPLLGPVAVAAERRASRAYPHILTVSGATQVRILDIRGNTPTGPTGPTGPGARDGRCFTRGIGRIPNGVECIPNGVDEAWFAETAVEESYILFFGRIDVYQKGLDTLLPAFAPVALERPDIELRLAGGGHPKHVRQMQEMVAQLGLGHRARLLGRVPREELLELARRALFVCMPSRFEGQGIVALEAAASGKAVLATDVAGLNEAVINGETGLLVPPGDTEALTHGMQRLLDDRRLRRRLGERGRARVRRDFTWDGIAERIEDAYLRVLRERPNRRRPLSRR